MKTKRLSLEGFLRRFSREVRARRTKWHLVSGLLRADTVDQCPIEFLAGRGKYGAYWLGRKMGLHGRDMYVVMDAADRVSPRGRAKWVRSRLLRAAGLSR